MPSSRKKHGAFVPSLMAVVSNTTPIRELAKIGRLDLLHAAYGAIIIPQEVGEDLVAAGPWLGEAVESCDWIQTSDKSVRRAARALRKRTGLGLGECAAISLARTLGAERILLDDRLARRYASGLGLALGGTLSAVIFAKQFGTISSAREVLDALRSHGTRIGDALYAEVLAALDEW